MLGIIGGSGLYDLEGLNLTREHNVSTPFGTPSGAIQEGEFHGKKIAFLSRHGVGHKLLPHEINYRANIYALKSIGVRQIISISAVGSLREDIAPADLVLPTQFFDHTRGKREATFFGNGIAGHVAMAEPVCRNLVQDITQAASHIAQPIHSAKTYACVEGPRLGTRAESFFLRQVGADIVGMTNIPEVFLAREAQMAYATIAIATDYDCWQDDPAQHVSVEAVFAVYGQALEKVKLLLKAVLQHPVTPPCPMVRESLRYAIMTPQDNLNSDQQSLLEMLRR
ncbi:MAG: S-methyl-5'-thioadenosine phosphorylase [Alphaproteobacteria bacterium]|nr:S-methyl-5'-thioadenosine phosphorylase [Alphaproteobacteria bacterium]